MDEAEFKDRQIWVRAFYGFDPEHDGLIGFTLEQNRTTMMDKMRDGDLVLIYGAVDSLTDQNLQRQALGFLEVQLEECLDRERMSPSSIQWRKERGFQDRWNYGIRVTRAWRVTNRVHIKTIAPESYRGVYRFDRTTRAKLLEPDEHRRALSHHVRQVNVYGEEPVNESDLETGSLKHALRPSKGIPPTYGARSSNMNDGENHVYLMKFSGGAKFLLGHSGYSEGQALVKVGRSNDPARRLSEINTGFPERSTAKWSLVNTQKFPSGVTAHAVECDIKTAFGAAFNSEGGEFFSGDWDSMQNKFQNVCISSIPHILGAPGKAKGVK
ncbi:hypothetical protein GO984_22505 [Rhodobacteraceae bacterium CY05]|uniref:Bacteriophage T5 Orf172 DNA-binding domain-containing protein n=1 Tax=Parasedimentitalea huanghaiensis TaxID=2682100 RepID=A0A6L6WPH4_9RHOB|nr:hypothetical protein [Zongyanglinia huanghaiensis]